MDAPHDCYADASSRSDSRADLCLRAHAGGALSEVLERHPEIA